MSISDAQPLIVPIIAIAKIEPNSAPPAIRLRRWLKVGLRVYDVRVEWQPMPKKDPRDSEREAR